MLIVVSTALAAPFVFAAPTSAAFCKAANTDAERSLPSISASFSRVAENTEPSDAVTVPSAFKRKLDVESLKVTPSFDRGSNPDVAGSCGVGRVKLL